MKILNYVNVRDLGYKLLLFLPLLSLFVSVSIFGQAAKETPESNIDCRLPRRLGLYVQMTESKWTPPKGYAGEEWIITKAKITDDEWWTPSDMALVDPIYKLYLFKEKPDGMPEGKCAVVALIEGQLITPGGKVFRFEQATFDRKTLLLRFTTIRRNRLRYEGEFQFFAKPLLLGSFGSYKFQAGTMNLKADAPDLGVMSLTFPVKSHGSE